MRTLVLLLLTGTCALALSTGPMTTNTNQLGQKYIVADKPFLIRQMDILRLLKHVNQPNLNKDQVEIATSWRIEDHINQYTNQQHVKEFLRLWNDDALPRGEVFSVFYERPRNESIALFRILYGANDFETFYKTAAWARDNVNEGIFVYALQVAILHRPDTQGIIIPPLYEINPNLFVNSEVMNKAIQLKLRFGTELKASSKDNRYIVQANYTGWYLNVNPEQSDLAYFTEDIGLNNYYYNFHLDYPFWLGGEEIGLKKDRRGELHYWVHQQILARYYLERLSNDLGSIPVFDWEQPIETGYVPSLTYSNGLVLPTRPADTNLVTNPLNQPFTVSGEDNQMLVQEIEDYERRIRDAIDSGIVITPDGSKINIYTENGFDVLGRIVEGSPDSPNRRLYGVLQVIARHVLGCAPRPIDQYKINPSALEQFETALRDPAFYQLYKRLIVYFLRYKSHLPTYTYGELNLPGVKVESVNVDKLVTYFDQFDLELTNALYVSQQDWERDGFQVWARQLRLNHKPFTYKVNVVSDRSMDVVVRVFLGPKYDEQGREIPINENRVNFIELDKFVQTLQPGKNVVERNSRQGNKIRDRTSFRTLWQRVQAAMNSKEEFPLDMSEAHNGFPNRLVLPKGKVGGQVFQIYVYVSPLLGTPPTGVYNNIISAGIGSGARYIDNLPFGFPLDRQIKNEHAFLVQNSIIEDVVIFHKNESIMNKSQSQGEVGELGESGILGERRA